MHKWLAGRLIRLAHRINPPKPTEYPVQDFHIHIDSLGGDLSSYETKIRATNLGYTGHVR
ncbi:hypothetical protein [Nocardia sp. NBC_01327]|uniref:hypothetical protein n=1 Tax=Nocardia sp. NBC_01327 TaxID=2903593 RepID=UPI002E11AE02|nr:hypothetical protein OG326_23695 [Nocardia sp. NBC_01327]